MTIRNIDNFLAQLWDWAILDGCFGTTKIKPTDIDGLVERNGKFLLLEGKGLGVPLPMAQAIMFRHLLATGIFTIIIIWGTPDVVEYMQVMRSSDEGQRKPATNEDLRNVVKWWFRQANIKGA